MLTGRDVVELAIGDRPTVFRAGTARLAVISPLYIESGLIDPRTGSKINGIPVGYCGTDRTGGVFTYDEIMVWQAGIVADGNVLVFGMTGHRKSALAKCHIYRGAAYGYNHLVFDLKAEYRRLVQAIPGAREIVMAENASFHISPVDRSLDIEAQMELNTLLVRTWRETTVGLNSEEKSLLRKALEELHASTIEKPVLSDLRNLMRDPSPSMVAYMAKDLETVKAQAYELFLALQGLCEGAYGAVLNHPTTPGALDPCPLLVINCANLTGTLRTVILAVAKFYTSAQWGKEKVNRFHKVIHDEAWDLVGDPNYLEGVIRSFKLGGTWGVVNWMITHHENNLQRAAGERVKELMSDSSTRIYYRQTASELNELNSGLNPAETNHVTKLQPGNSLWKFGDQTGLPVEHYAWPEELPVIETRHLFKGQDPNSGLLLKNEPEESIVRRLNLYKAGTP